MFSWLLISSIFFIGSFIFITVKLVRLQRASIKDERLELLRQSNVSIVTTKASLINGNDYTTI